MMLLLPSALPANADVCAMTPDQSNLHGDPNPYKECTIPSGKISVKIKCNHDGPKNTYQKVGWSVLSRSDLSVNIC